MNAHTLICSCAEFSAAAVFNESYGLLHILTQKFFLLFIFLWVFPQQYISDLQSGEGRTGSVLLRSKCAVLHIMVALCLFDHTCTIWQNIKH